MDLKLFIILISVSSITAEEIVSTEKEDAEAESEPIISLNLVEENTSALLAESFYINTDTNLELAPLANETINSTETNNTQKFVQCIPTGTSEVQLVNDTELIKLLRPLTNITSKDTPASCILVLFYSKYCPFSSLAAPHFNALPRAFPAIKMVAINAMMYHLFNTQNGIVGVPSLLLFHNGKPVAKYNQSVYSLDLFSKFLTRHTGIPAEEKSHVTSADFSGPVTSVPSKDSDMLLVISWLFIILCAVYYFTKSKWWRWIVETVQSNWRESAQHEHVE